MGEQVRYADYRFFLRLPDDDGDLAAVLFHHNAMDGKGKGGPLVFLDASVIVGVQIGQFPLLVERILLHIQSGGVNVGCQDIHPFFQRLGPQMKQHCGFFHGDGVNPISGLQALPVLYDLGQIPVACGFGHDHCRFHGPRSVLLWSKSSVMGAEGLQLL